MVAEVCSGPEFCELCGIANNLKLGAWNQLTCDAPVTGDNVMVSLRGRKMRLCEVRIAISSEGKLKTYAVRPWQNVSLCFCRCLRLFCYRLRSQCLLQEVRGYLVHVFVCVWIWICRWWYLSRWLFLLRHCRIIIEQHSQLLLNLVASLRCRWMHGWRPMHRVRKTMWEHGLQFQMFLPIWSLRWLWRTLHW